MIERIIEGSARAMGLTPNLNSSNSLATSFSFLIDILLPFFFIYPPSILEGGM